MKLNNEKIWTLLIILTVVVFWLGRKGIPGFIGETSFESVEVISGEEVIDRNIEASEEENDFITVHIAGAVKNPGVYNLQNEARVIDGIIAAGGETKTAYLDGINLAETLLDGEQILIPELDIYEEAQNFGETEKKSNNFSPNNGKAVSRGKININRADISTLATLNGIGEVRAADIVNYREEKGPFSSVDELLIINGIGEAILGNIKDKVTVR